MLVLPRDEAFRRVGAVAEQIARREPQDIFQHCLRIGSHAVDRRVDQPQHRHRHGVDRLGLRIELRGDQSGRRFRRQREDRPARRAHRLAVEAHGKAVAFRHHRHILVETLRQRRLHLDLRPADRIGVRQQLARFEV